ncbi:hypothetical protein D049_0538, partial [Vibrio parahaemolyticus VPTS-2010]
ELLFSQCSRNVSSVEIGK